MQYTYPVEEYKKLLLEYNEQDKLSFSPDDAKEYVVAALKERNAKKRALAEVANVMMREYVETFEKDPTAMTPEDAETLEAFGEVVFPKGVVSFRVDVTDLGVFYRVEKLLVEHYKRREDWERLAFVIDRCVFSEMLLFCGHSFHINPSAYYDDCVGLVGRIGDGVLSEKAALKALSALARTTVTSEDQFPLELIRNVDGLLLSHMKQPYSDSDEAFLNFYYDIVLQLFREHAIYAKAHGVTVDVEAARPLLEKMLAYFSDSGNEKKREMLINGNNALIIGFLLGNITLEEALDGLDEIIRVQSQDENPVVKANALATLNHYYLTLLYWFSPLPKEEIVRRSRERVREVLPQIMSVSRAVNNSLFNRSIIMFLSAASLTGSFDEFSGIALETTVYADKALYIHTVMVKEISRAIFDHMIEKTPEAFGGVCGRDAEYFRAHREEMRKLLDECCMFHDVGKFFVIDIVENSMRRLSDAEFGLIKEHPENFDNTLQLKEEEKDERVMCIRDCAMTHHLWHNGANGYPLNLKHTKNRPFVDIISIADSIDAATDYIGRPYHGKKTLDELIEEIRQTAGTRYGAEAAAALSAPEVRARLERLISEEREEINYRIYTAGKLADNA